MRGRGHVFAGIAVAVAALSGGAGVDLAERFRQLTRDVVWTQADVVEVDFDTFHPQGFARVEEHLFLSSVEVLEPTQRFDTPRDGYDRSPGSGRGHLFKMDLEGRLLGHLELGEGSIYHPGGIDFDGAHLWVPVAEYRPNSRSIVYRVDAEAMEAEEAFRFDDHLGGLVRDPESGTLHGVSWGSRRFYTWTLGGESSVSKLEHATNPSYYIDYQDCQYAGGGAALCGGLSHYRGPAGDFSLGGIELVDLRDGRPIHQIPLALWTESGRPMTQNPVELELTDAGLRAYFLPEDNRSRLFVYDAALPE